MNDPSISATKFMEKVSKDPTGCWLWTGSLDTPGYGTVGSDSRKWLAHRVAYRLFVGPIPDGLTIDHLCRVRHCVNPDHLEPVTNAENIRRGMSPSAINARKTHCTHGHEFTPENTRITPQGRKCRICVRREKQGWEKRRQRRRKVRGRSGLQVTPPFPNPSAVMSHLPGRPRPNP